MVLNFHCGMIGFVGLETRRYRSYESRQRAYADIAVSDADMCSLAKSKGQFLAKVGVKAGIMCNKGIVIADKRSIEANTAYILFVCVLGRRLFA